MTDGERGTSIKSLRVPEEMLARLKEHIEDGDYCFLCDCHPGEKHYRHDATCPLRAECPHPRHFVYTNAAGETMCEDCGRKIS